MSKQPGKKSVQEWLTSLNKNTLGILICALVIILALVVFLLTRGVDSTDTGKVKHDESISSVESYEEIGDSNIGGVTTDGKDDGKAWQELNDEEYSIEITVIEGGWTGEYMEDGSDESVKNVLALKFTNKGERDIQYAEYVFEIKDKPISFKVSDLPAGQSCIALETKRHEFKKKEVLSLKSRVVAQVDELPFARDEVMVVDNSNDSISVMNLTEKEIPIVRVFYKTYDHDKEMYIGGITYTAKVEKIPAGGGVTVKPSHYQSGKSVVLGTGVYPAES